MWIQDLFFLHQHARKINIWALALVISPFLGPLLGAFMVNFVSWRWPYWVYAIETGIILVLVVLFVDEPYYDRSIPEDQQPIRRSRIRRLIGTEQWQSRHQRNTFLEACMRPIQAMRWPVFIPCFFYLVTFAWSVGVNNALSVFLSELYHFTPKNTGMSFVSRTSTSTIANTLRLLLLRPFNRHPPRLRCWPLPQRRIRQHLPTPP